VSERFILRRLGNVDLEFHGQLLANETSFEEGKNRWTEVRIYSTESGKWITEVVGCSTVEGEINRPKVLICHTPQEVVEGMRAWSHEKQMHFFSNIVLDALDAAAHADPRLASVVREQV
jgi:hypothetical protein